MSDAPQVPGGSPAGTARVTLVAFLVTLARTAAVHFGDLPDPATGAARPIDLAAAQQVIDVIAMLEEKTRGNLTPEERQLIDGMLHDLRLRHAEVSGRRPSDAASAGRVRP